MRIAHLVGTALLTATLGLRFAQAAPEPKLPVLDGVGGDFSAPSSLGREVRLADYRGKVVLVFFGYTSCQDVCPVTLSHLKNLVQRLGPAADAVQVLFVTVDPEVDTGEVLAKYLPRYDARFVGLTGTRGQVDAIAALFMAEAHRTHDVHVSTEHHRTEAYTEQAYLYTHAQQIYLLDTAGRTRGLYFSGSPLPEMEQAVRSLLTEAATGATDGSHDSHHSNHPKGAEERHE